MCPEGAGSVDEAEVIRESEMSRTGRRPAKSVSSASPARLKKRAGTRTPSADRSFIR
jgi:hypothetical protein